MQDLTKHPRYDEAQRHIRNLRGFYTHAIVYGLVIAGLAALNYLSSPGRLWFFYPALGWGIGLAAHGFSVFAFRGWLGSDWEDRKIREYLDRRS